MNAFQWLNNRVSQPLLEAPAPTPQQLERLLQAAVSAPDHGRLRPWRFLVLEGEQLERLGAAFVEEARQDMPAMDERACERIRNKPKRAPMIITVVAEVTPDHKVPVLEQVMAAACAAEHIMLAADALGLGCMWRTGKMARSPVVKQVLGFADKDEIVAFLYLGTPKEGKSRELLDPQDFVRQLP